MLYLAAKAFGKFQNTFSNELNAETMSHIKQETAGLAHKPVQGIVVHGNGVLDPEIARPGGLIRSDTVGYIYFFFVTGSQSCTETHSDNQLNRCEPLTPRGSLLGPDRLAKGRRDQANIENRSRQRPRLDDDVIFNDVCDSIVSLYGG